MTTALRRLERLWRLRNERWIIARDALARCAAALATLEDRQRLLLGAEASARSRVVGHTDPTAVALEWAYADAMARRRTGVGADRARAAHDVDMARAVVRARRREEAALALVCRRRRARRDASTDGRTR